MYQLSLPFDETYAWTEFIRVLGRIKKGEHLVFYGFERKLSFTKIKRDRIAILSERLDSVFIEKQRMFEVTFMATVLKDPHRHLHTFEKSLTRNKDWRKQVYRCIDPDCTSYFQAAQIIGKRALCWKCHQPIIIDKSQIRNAKIVGLCCSKSHKAKLNQKAKDAITDIFDQLEEKETAGEEPNNLESISNNFSIPL